MVDWGPPGNQKRLAAFIIKGKGVTKLTELLIEKTRSWIACISSESKNTELLQSVYFSIVVDDLKKVYCNWKSDLVIMLQPQISEVSAKYGSFTS